MVRPALRAGPTGDQGMVTAELAAALPVLVLAVSLLLSVVGVAADSSRALEAARSAARAAGAGTAGPAVIEQTAQLAPEGSAIRVWTDGPWVRVEVLSPRRHWGPLPLPVPPATAAALLEPGVAP